MNDQSPCIELCQFDGKTGLCLGCLRTQSECRAGHLFTTLTPGTYEVTWRVLSDDGHTMSGVLHFTLTGEHATGHPAQH
jgi:hypothetical protein